MTTTLEMAAKQMTEQISAERVFASALIRVRRAVSAVGEKAEDRGASPS